MGLDVQKPQFALPTGMNVQHFCVAGRYISFDSTHTWETGMQTYVVGVQTLAVQPPPPPPAAPSRRHLYCDLAVRSARICHAAARGGRDKIDQDCVCITMTVVERPHQT